MSATDIFGAPLRGDGPCEPEWTAAQVFRELRGPNWRRAPLPTEGQAVQYWTDCARAAVGKGDAAGAERCMTYAAAVTWRRPAPVQPAERGTRRGRETQEGRDGPPIAAYADLGGDRSFGTPSSIRPPAWEAGENPAVHPGVYEAATAEPGGGVYWWKRED